MCQNSLFLSFFLLLLLSSVYANASSSVLHRKHPVPSTKYEFFKAGIFVMNVGKVDVTSGSFYMDFYLMLTQVSQPENYYVPEESSLRFINANKDMSIVALHDRFRVRSTFYFNPSLSDYPFDRQDLNVLLEYEYKTNATFKFIPDFNNSGLSSSIVFPGVVRDNLKYDMRVVDVTSIVQEAHSRLIFTLYAERPAFNSFIKFILPPTILVGVALASLTLSIVDHTAARFNICGSMLVSTVMFHASVANQGFATLTTIDNFLIVVYAILAFIYGLNIILLKAQKTFSEGTIRTLDRYTAPLLLALPACLLYPLRRVGWIVFCIFPPLAVVLIIVQCLWHRGWRYYRGHLVYKQRLKRHARGDDVDGDGDEDRIILLQEFAPRSSMAAARRPPVSLDALDKPEPAPTPSPQAHPQASTDFAEWGVGSFSVRPEQRQEAPPPFRPASSPLAQRSAASRNPPSREAFGSSAILARRAEEGRRAVEPLPPPPPVAERELTRDRAPLISRGPEDAALHEADTPR